MATRKGPKGLLTPQSSSEDGDWSLPARQFGVNGGTHSRSVPAKSPAPANGGRASPRRARRQLAFALLAAAAIWLLLTGIYMGSFIRTPMHRQDVEEECEGSGRVSGQAAGGEAQVWFTEIADEYDALRRQILALQTQKERLLGENSTVPGALDAIQLHHTAGMPRPFLFVAVLTTTSTLARREAVRDTWMQDAEKNGVLARFILTEEERNPAVEEEQAKHGDLVFVRRGSGLGYRSIVYKVFLALEWVVDNLDPLFILKTDDDAYIDTAAMVAALRGLCLNADCRDERLYLGSEKRNGEVITDEANKWSNLEYFRLTGLREYAPYMMGGGYAFSSDVARALVETHAIAPLKFMPNEDATFGFWVMGMNLRRIDHPRAKTPAGHCCWGAVAAEDAGGRWAPFRLRPYDRICAQWLILHKVDNNDQMRYIHERLAQCPEQEALEGAAQKLAAAAGRPWPVVGPLETAAVTDWRAGFHLFGYNDKTPWSADSSCMLGLRTALSPRDLQPGDSAQIGLIPFSKGKPVSQDRAGWAWEPLATTTAWNYQIGANAQWVGRSSRLAAFNAQACLPGASSDDLCTVVIDVVTKRRLRVLPRPIFTISPDGRMATSIDFVRLGRGRPGFGYAASRRAGDAATREKCPKEDGLWLMDMASGKAELLVSLRELYDAVAEDGAFGGGADPVTGLPYKLQDRMPAQTLRDCLHWLNHPQFSADGRSIVFLYRIGKCPRFFGAYFRTYVFTIDVTGQHLWRVPVVEGAYHDFGRAGRLLVADKDGYTVLDVRKNATRLAPPPALARLGPLQPASFRGDFRYLAMASSGDPRRLVLWDTARNDTLMLGYFSPKDWEAPAHLKAGLSPRWSPDGRYLSFDSAHVWGTGSQMYVTGVQLLRAGWPAEHGQQQRQRRRILLDLTVRGGATLANLAAGDLHPSLPPADAFTAIHAFQAAALSREARMLLDVLVKQLGLAQILTLHPQAVGVRDNATVAVNTAGRSRRDVQMEGLANLLLAPDGGGGPLPQSDGRWAPWRGAGADQPPADPPGAATEFGHSGQDVDVPGLDLSEWMRSHLRVDDDVTLVVDLGGREHGLLAHLLRGGTLPLADQVLVHWHTQHLNWEWPLVWEGIAASLGVVLEAIPRPEDVAAARRAAAIGGRAAPLLLDPQHSLAHLQKHLQQAA